MEAIAYRNKNSYWWMIVLIILIIIYFTRCTTYEKCLDKYGTTVNDTTFHTFYDTAQVSVDVAVSPDEITGTIDPLALNQDSLVYESEQGRAKATFWKDQYNALRFKAECLPDTIVKEVQVPYEVKVPVTVTTTKFIAPPKKTEKQNSLIERIAMFIGTGVLIILLLVALWFGGKKILETYFPALKLLKWLK